MLDVIIIRIFMCCSFFLAVHGFYFHLKEGEEKCFIRELPKKTLLVAHYKCTPFIGRKTLNHHLVNQTAGMMVEIRDPKKHILLSRMYRERGRFSFTSHEPGEHMICMHTKQQSIPGRMLRVDFGLTQGEHRINYTLTAEKEKLTDIHTKFKELLEKSAEVVKEMEYLRYREALFRDSSETISRRVLMWSVGQTFLLVLIAVWQMERYKQFFESKKLV